MERRVSAAPANTITEVVPGVWLAHFPDADLVNAAFCEPLVPPLVEGSRMGPVVLLADLPDEVRLVHPNMVPYWLNVFFKRGVAVRAIGVVTRHRGVKMILNGLQLAMKMKGHELPVATRTSREELLAWAATV